MALTGKQTLFVEAYLRCWNKTESARQAGYAGNDATLGAIGYENFKKPEIFEEIQRRISESAMSADEVLMRLGDQARGNMGDFWKIEEGQPPTLDLTSDKAKLPLIKKMKVKTTKRFYTEDEDPVTEVTTEIDFELYDAQAALEKLGRHHKLFTDKTEVTGKDGAPLEAKITHAIDSSTATSIFDILAESGVFESGASDAKADEVHSAQADA